MVVYGSTGQIFTVANSGELRTGEGEDGDTYKRHRRLPHICAMLQGGFSMAERQRQSSLSTTARLGLVVAMQSTKVGGF
jgi:hypothetical protein